MNQGYYQPTAYRKSMCPEGRGKAKSSMLNILTEYTQLAWHSNYTYLNNLSWQFPGRWLDYYLLRKKNNFPEHCEITHETLKNGGDGKWDALNALLYFLFCITGIFSFPMAWFMTVVLWVMYIITLFGEPADFNIHLILFAPILFIPITYIHQVIRGIQIKRDVIKPRWNGEGFYRRTGMVVTAYGEYHFTEFDPIIERTIMQNGTASLSLVLRLREPPKDIPQFTIHIDSTGANLAHARAAWDFLLRYMDVEEPLPDVPDLEAFRALDPTTHAYDQAGKRAFPDNFWFDLYKNNSETKFINFLWSTEGRNKDNPIAKMESEYMEIVSGYAPARPPYVPKTQKRKRARSGVRKQSKRQMKKERMRSHLS